jgi:hypothetical protein
MAIKAIARTRSRALLTSVAIISLLVSLGQTAMAYNDFDNELCKWTNGTTVQVNWHWGATINQSGYWSNAFRLASDAWTQAGTKVRMGFSSSAQAQANVEYASSNIDGETLYVCHSPDIWNGMAYFYSYGNLANLPDYSQNYSRMKQVSTHEFGHGLGLGHSYNQAAVMCKTSCNNIPTYDDWSGLNSLYP